MSCVLQGDYIRRLVDAAPPLNADQRARLEALLRADRDAMIDAVTLALSEPVGQLEPSELGGC